MDSSHIVYSGYANLCSMNDSDHISGQTPGSRPTFQASHVAGVGNAGSGLSKYVIDTSKRSFANLEFILDAVSEEGHGKGAQGKAFRDAVVLNGVHALKRSAPRQFINPADRNYDKILHDLDYYSRPLADAEKDSDVIDLLRPHQPMAYGKQGTNLMSALSGAVVSASKQASFAKCVKRWSKLDEEDASKFPALKEYFDKVKRPAALEILRLRVEKASWLRNGGVLTDEKVGQAIDRALNIFFEACPVESDRSERETHKNLLELKQAPKATTITLLYDQADLKLIDIKSAEHSAKFIHAYEKEMLNKLPLLEEALNDVKHPLHKMADSFYCARWGQVMEELQSTLQYKTRIFPKPFEEPNQSRY